MIIIKNGNILTMETVQYTNGYVIIEENRISDVGDMAEYDAAREEQACRVVDARGRVVMPGLIDAHCHIGIFEDGIGFEGDDGNEATDPATPHLRALDAVNPMDRSFAEALAEGITTVVTGPGSANPIGGQVLAMKTYGRGADGSAVCVDDMVIKEPLAVKIAFGENPKFVYHGKDRQPATRMATAAIIRENLMKAREYADAWDEYAKDPEEYDKPDIDVKYEALRRVINGEIPLHAHAHRADDIFTAIRIAAEFGVKLAVIHCTEGHLIAGKLAGVPVMAGPSLSERSKIELKNLSFETPRVLCENGVCTAIVTDHPVVPIKYLRLCAALAVREGMDEMDALKAITISAARNTGLSDRVGSIAKGKDGDIVIFSGNPLDICSKVDIVIFNEIVKENL